MGRELDDKDSFCKYYKDSAFRQINVAGNSLLRDKFFYVISNPHGNHCNKSNMFPYILFIKH